MFFKRGDRVVCANHEGIDPKFIGIYYPKVGTFGTVVIDSDVHDNDSCIQWDEGTKDGDWFVNNINIAPAPPIPFDPDVDNLLGSIYKEAKE